MLAEADHYHREVKRGYWYYDGLLKKGVAIVVINYDFWYEHEKSDGFDMSEETPQLNENGEMYIIRWYQDASFQEPGSWSISGLTLEGAIEQATQVVQQEIQWIQQ